MDIKRRRFIAAFINAIIIFAVFLLRFSGIATLQIGEAVPIILIPIVISVSMFYGENAGLISALFAGLLMDSVASDTSCFNTLFFVLGATVCGVMANRFLNRNLKAAICLSIGLSFIYYFLKYLIFFVFNGISVNYDYFVLNLIPSAVYTALWIIPFYFLQKKLSDYQ